MYLSGEESASSRAFAFFVDQPGTGDFPLVSMGRLQFENVMPCPYPQVKTIVACTDDFSPGFVTFHIADKLAVGTDLDKSGLIGGRVYGTVWKRDEVVMILTLFLFVSKDFKLHLGLKEIRILRPELVSLWWKCSDLVLTRRELKPRLSWRCVVPQVLLVPKTANGIQPSLAGNKV